MEMYPFQLWLEQPQWRIVAGVAESRRLLLATTKVVAVAEGLEVRLMVAVTAATINLIQMFMKLARSHHNR